MGVGLTRGLEYGGFLLAALLVVLTAGESLALAQDEPTGERDEEARTTHDAAAAAYDDGEMGLAFQLFERAYRLSPRPELLYNIGSSAERSGQMDRAIEAYRAFAQALPNHEKIDFVQARLRELGRNSESRDGQTNSPSGLVLALGTSIAIVGAGLLSVGIVGFATAGCTRNAGDMCIEETVPVGASVATYMVAGALALAGGVTWVILEATSGSGPEAQEVRVGVGPTSLTLGGTW